MTQSLVQEFSEDVRGEDVFISTLDTRENQEVVLTDTVEATEDIEINIQKTILDGFRRLIKEANLNKDNFEDFCFEFNVVDAITGFLGKDKVEEMNLTLEKKMSYNKIFRNLIKTEIGKKPTKVEESN